MQRLALVLLSILAVLTGPIAAARADTKTRLPWPPSVGGGWLAVDPAGRHVFVSGGPRSSSIVVLTFAGQIVKRIPGQDGGSQMALDLATHTLYVALRDDNAISEIDTRTLRETGRFSTAPYTNPFSITIAAGKLWFTCRDYALMGCPGVVEADLDGSHRKKAPLPIENYDIGTLDTATAVTSGRPGGKYLVEATTDGSPTHVDVYDVSGTTPTLVTNILATDGDAANFGDMTFDPSGATLLLAAPGPDFVEALTTTTLASSFKYPTGIFPASVAVTPDGKYVACGVEGPGNDPDVFVYPVDNSTPVRTWNIAGWGEGLPHSLAFSPDGTELFALAPDYETGELIFHVLSSPTGVRATTAISLTLATPSRIVPFGTRVRLPVRVKGTAEGTVDLYATRAGGVARRVSTATLSSGAASFTVTPTGLTTYSAELRQSSTWASSTSRDVSVRVAAAVRVSIRRLGVGVYKRYHAVETELRTRVYPVRSDVPVTLVVERQVAGHWHVYEGRQLVPALNGVARMVLYTSSRPARFRFHALYPGDAHLVAGRSAWKTFAIR